MGVQCAESSQRHASSVPRPGACGAAYLTCDTLCKACAGITLCVNVQGKAGMLQTKGGTHTMPSVGQTLTVKHFCARRPAASDFYICRRYGMQTSDSTAPRVARRPSFHRTSKSTAPLPPTTYPNPHTQRLSSTHTHKWWNDHSASALNV